MVAFPPCKINLGLQILNKRPDGYHDIETCFYPVLWTDILEIIPGDSFSFTVSGQSIPGNGSDNLCVKAYHLLGADHSLPPVQIHLHKIIPMGAGLGGGSSDAAYTLRLLNDVFKLNLSSDQLSDYASRLGSDCAFFTQHGCLIGTGRGEKLEPVSLNLNGKFLVIVKPDVHVSTAEAYSGVILSAHEQSIRKIIVEKPITEWRALLVNDFEPWVFKKYPVIQTIKEKLYSLGAQYASMSGSGSAVFGIFEKQVEWENHFPNGHCWSGILED